MLLAAGLRAGASSVPSDKDKDKNKDKADVLLTTMQEEIAARSEHLGKLDPAPYFLSYSVYDQSIVLAMGSQGSLVNSTAARRRAADVSMRIGTPALDNSHRRIAPPPCTSGSLPLEDDRNAIAHELWRLTYEEYRKASKAYAERQDQHAGAGAGRRYFSGFFRGKAADPCGLQGDVAPTPDQKALEKFVREYSAHFRKYPLHLFLDGAV